MNAHAQKAASGLFFEYSKDAQYALPPPRAIHLCNEIFALSADTDDLDTRLFCIRFVNFIFEHSELTAHRKELSAYRWSGVERLFMRDPSDPDSTLAFALFQLNTGTQKRAQQLLHRLSRSGLRHSDLGKTLIRDMEPQSELTCNS